MSDYILLNFIHVIYHLSYIQRKKPSHTFPSKARVYRLAAKVMQSFFSPYDQVPISREARLARLSCERTVQSWMGGKESDQDNVYIPEF